VNGYKIEHYANFGSGEPWVARTILGLPELVFAVPAFAVGRDEFRNELGEVFETLGMAFEELRELRRRVAEGAPALDLNRSYANLYGLLWQAYKDRFPKAMNALGVDIGFLFQKEANFEKRAAELVAARQELADLVDLMRHDRRDFQNGLGYYRNNVLEHRSGQVDSRLLQTFHRLDSAENTFENVWQAIEDYVTLTVIAHLPPVMQLVEIPEADCDPSRPSRFGFAVAGLPAG
jgi:hypothetical protein